jgi:hypothetical protein
VDGRFHGGAPALAVEAFDSPEVRLVLGEGEQPVRRFWGGRVQYGKNSLLSEKEASESSHYVASSVRKTHI